MALALLREKSNQLRLGATGAESAPSSPPNMVSNDLLDRLLIAARDQENQTPQHHGSTFLEWFASPAGTPLFDYFSEREASPGEIIFREDENGDTMYIIRSGQVAIIKGGLDTPIIIGFRRSGDMIGEMAVLEGQPRSASVVALTPVHLYSITRDKFYSLLGESPAISQGIMEMLSSRLRESDEAIRRESIDNKRLIRQVYALEVDNYDLTQLQDVLRQTNERLQAEIAEKEALQATLREQAIRDPLTGLFNRRYLQETLERELLRAGREGYTIGIILMDIDHFKKLNDTYGHSAGDLVLEALGQMLRSQTRGGDIPCRYGGEEFLVIMPGATLEVAARRAEALRLVFQELQVEYMNQSISATLSLGVSAFPTHGRSEAELLSKADKALYAAKNSGRNQVVVS
ncbi:MAG: GGDEF domain-containing protein [Anaerolineales bacterium]|nr:GGDEF domain-containing protein [Anaerolineales bacterium]